MFSKKVEYALRTCAYLSQQETLRSTNEIAKHTKVPKAYLAKVIQLLVTQKILNSNRGNNGGVSLSKPAGDISVLEIVNAVQPIQRILKCPLGIPEHRKKLCPLHKKLDANIAATEEMFRHTFLSEMTIT